MSGALLCIVFKRMKRKLYYLRSKGDVVRIKRTVIAPNSQSVGSGPTDNINRRIAVTTRVMRTAAVHLRRLVRVVSNVRLRLRLRCCLRRRVVFRCCCWSRSPPPPSSSSSSSSSSSTSSTSSALSSSLAHTKNAAAHIEANSPSQTAAETWPPKAAIIRHKTIKAILLFIKNNYFRYWITLKTCTFCLWYNARINFKLSLLLFTIIGC